MRMDIKKHMVQDKATVRDVLPILDQLAADAILFVTDETQILIGSLTDGDIRRGLMSGKLLDDSVLDFLQPKPHFLRKGEFELTKMKYLRDHNFKIIPVLNSHDRIVDIINFRLLKSFLPLDAVFMAGGKGKRLRPLTEKKPKPLLPIGGTPIIEINLTRLIAYGLENITVTLNYLGEQIEEYFGNGRSKGVRINYTHEEVELGTAGALSMINDFTNDDILVMNSDLLTNIDFEDFYADFLDSGAEMAVATTPYEVKVPYAVLETKNGRIHNFKEKPTYTYYSNAGIYLVKKKVIEEIPKGQYMDATDLMEKLITQGKSVVSYPIRDYWLDIGRMEDYEKAQEDIKHIKL